MEASGRTKFANCLVVGASLLMVLACNSTPKPTEMEPRPIQETSTQKPTETDPGTAMLGVILTPAKTKSPTTRPTETEPPTPRPAETQPATPRPTETQPATPIPIIIPTFPVFPTHPVITVLVVAEMPPVVVLVDDILIANYPLDQDAKDATGINSPMSLINAPFQDSGVYCNGIYQYSGQPNFCFVGTPRLEDFDFHSFSILVSFNAEAYRMMPVFVGGGSARWIGFFLNQDGSTGLMYNNSNIANCKLRYRTNQWHIALVTYDGKTGRLYLDGELGCAVDFAIDDHYNDKDISTTDFGRGVVFQGILGELKVYDIVLAP